MPFAVLSAWAICGEKLNARRLGGHGDSVGGHRSDRWRARGGPRVRLSLALVVLGTLSWGVAQALIRAWGRDDGPSMIGSVTLYASPQLALASLVLESRQVDAVRTATLLDWSAVLTLAVGGFVVAYSIWYGLIGRYRVDQVAPFALLMPLAGVVFGAALYGERLSALAAIGGLVVLSGLAFILKEPAVSGSYQRSRNVDTAPRWVAADNDLSGPDR